MEMKWHKAPPASHSLYVWKAKLDVVSHFPVRIDLEDCYNEVVVAPVQVINQNENMHKK